MVSLAWLVNHLWQSTLAAGAVWLLVITLRHHRAAARYWLWLAASAKFLIPFSGLVSLGSYLGWSAAAEPRGLTLVIDAIGQPFSPAPPRIGEAIPSPSALTVFADFLPAVLLMVWVCGCAAVVVSWWRGWRRLRVVVRQGRRVAAGRELDALARFGGPPVEMMLTSGSPLAPGVVGLLRPMLLWPSGISARLDDRELEAILAHELAHVRRRDNLTSIVHMAVEAIVWFHPLVWWIGGRLLEERERACDEVVLRSGSEPHVYAESILKTCEFSLAARVPCMAGAAGSSLKPRIERIMTEHIARPLGAAGKLLMTCAGVVTVIGPVVFGAVNSPRVGAQSADRSRPAFEVASVKPNKAGGRPGGAWFQPGGRLSATNVTLRQLVEAAYRVTPYKGYVTGGPTWLDSARFDIEAKAEDGAIPRGTSDRARVEKTSLMLRTLLEDRFKLRVARSEKALPIYELTVAKNGPKLTKTANAGCSTPDTRCHNFFGGGGRGVHGHAVTMQDLADFLSLVTDRTVRDRTRIMGLFDIETTPWYDSRRRRAEGATEEEGGSDPLDPDMFTVFQEQLGLKLIPQKGPVDVFVVEHAEQPTDD